MITEISTPRTQARAFSLFAFSNNLGIFLGPLIGTTLARRGSCIASNCAKVDRCQIQ